ncbi:hypothetical protein [Halegenticoccus tardaugens]|uniref:hypothetical protein n=1 Tax=Halegenticoccus tardaugens TaxID=2071624 RepID=UPI00100A3B4A|nr:hypothetical protein [Halegenticoccus tardaugens]
MAGRRGFDYAADERQLRPREENDAVGTWLETLFDGTVEVIVFGLPTLLWVALSQGAVTTLVAIVSLSAAAFGIGAVRNDRLRVGPPWPPVSPSLAALRVGYYNLLFVAVSLATPRVVPESVTGIDLPWSSTDVVVAGAVAAGATLAAVVAFPSIAIRIEEYRDR